MLSKRSSLPERVVESNISDLDGRKKKKLTDSGYNIKVYVRCRSRNNREIQEKSSVVISTIEGDCHQVILNNGTNSSQSKIYTFDQVFGPDNDQEYLFNHVAKEYIDEMIQGYNCTVFAYGQTGTGKTYTMTGDMSLFGNSSNDNNILLSENAGIIPRVLVSLFKELTRESQDYSVKISFLELYNEKLKDLLVECGSDELESIRIFDNLKKDRGSNNSILIKGMDEIYIKSAREGLDLLSQGSIKRQVASTKCNDLSSRSHTIFTITTNITKIDPISGEEYVKIGKLNLVDLAGSENINRSGAENKRAQEAGSINKSLLTLGRVINALVEHAQHIPYRESKLTRILQDSLGGRTKTCIIAAISPAKVSLDETISTLEYATRAKSIKNTPQINQSISKDSRLTEYIQEIEKLKKELKASHTKQGIYISQEKYDLHESNLILIDEQNKKINNLNVQLKKIREKYLNQVSISKEKDCYIDNLKKGYESLYNGHESLKLSFNNFQNTCETFESKIKEIHAQNLKLLKNISSEKDSLHDYLLGKMRYEAESKELIKIQVSSLEQIQNSLQSYNQSFSSVIKGIFHDLNVKFNEFTEITNTYLNSSEQNDIYESFNQLNDSFCANLEELNIVITKSTEALDLSTNKSFESWIKSFSVDLENIKTSIFNKITSLEDDLLEKIETFQKLIQSRILSITVNIEGYQNNIKAFKDNTLKKHITENKILIDDKLIEFQKYTEDIISKFRQNNYDTIKNGFDYMINQLKENEERSIKIEHSIMKQASNMLNGYNSRVITEIGDTLENLIKQSEDTFEFCKVNTEEIYKLYEGHINNQRKSLGNKEVTIKVGEISSKCEEFLKVWDTTISQQVSNGLTSLGTTITNHSTACQVNARKDIDSIILEFKNFSEVQNNNLKNAKSELNTVSEYIKKDYKDNIFQVGETQGEIVSSELESLRSVLSKLNNIITEPTSNNSPTSNYNIRTAIFDLPILERPKKAVETYASMISDPNIDPSMENEAILNTPIPIFD